MEIRYFTKENGKIKSHFHKLPDWEYKIQVAKKNRTLKSNRYYFWYVLTFIIERYREFWYIYTKDKLHKIFKTAFVPRKRIKSDFSRKYVMVKWSTAELNSKQFSDYLKMIESIFEFWEMEQLKLEKIDNFTIPDINEDELLYRESKIL